jgi:hypothetical protein
MNANEAQARSKALDNALQSLGEHFNHVQIMATADDEGSTISSFRGCGNWYARQGLAHEFINNEQAQENATAIAEKLKPEEGE